MGCRRESPDTSSATTQPPVQTSRPATPDPLDTAAYYDRTTRQFSLADFIKPSGENTPERVIGMSPLIVREIAEPFADLHFGLSIEALLWKDAANEMDKRVIYYHEDTTTLAGIDWNRLSFLWIYDVERRPDMARTRIQGFRMTLDENGYAIFWEVLSPTGPRLVYVAQSIEDAASNEFGAAPADRRFAVERPLAEAPDTIVPRILPDGPQPMGPFVYIEGQGHDITTLLCRCMPSQVDDFRKNVLYDLRPLPSGDSDKTAISVFDDLLHGAADIPLDAVLRIPNPPSTVP
ncbi:MAG: hypothetical protein KDA33_06695 [Phycisphaerales bacterium]|nr:hypothetical protein [Phycisphaerales bacterium]